MDRANLPIKLEMDKAGIKSWQLAELLGIHEVTLSRYLRKPLTDEKRVEIIGKIREKYGAGGDVYESPKMYMRTLDSANELSDETIYRDVCEILRRAGVLKIEKHKSGVRHMAQCAVMAGKLEGKIEKDDFEKLITIDGGWIKPEDLRPKDGETVLAIDWSGDYTIGCFKDGLWGEKQWGFYDDIDGICPQYWRPLPPMPEEGQ